MEEAEVTPEDESESHVNGTMGFYILWCFRLQLFIIGMGEGVISAYV